MSDNIVRVVPKDINSHEKLAKVFGAAVKANNRLIVVWAKRDFAEIILPPENRAQLPEKRITAIRLQNTLELMAGGTSIHPRTIVNYDIKAGFNAAHAPKGERLHKGPRTPEGVIAALPPFAVLTYLP